MFDHATWDYRSLQKLCRTLGLKQNGTRQNLIQRLQRFHRENSSDHFGAGAFANIGVQVYSSPSKRRTRVSKKFLSPCVRRATGSPILKRESSFAGEETSCMSPEPRAGGIRCRSSVKRRSSAKRICFSPYNQVRLIPHRHDLQGSPVVRSMDFGDDEL